MNSAVFDFLALQIEHSKVFDEAELVFYLPQIVQALRFELLIKDHGNVGGSLHVNTIISNRSKSSSSMRKISMASINEDEEDYLPAFSRSLSSASSTMFEGKELPSPLAMALISRSLRSSIVASKLMWLLRVEMSSESSSNESSKKRKGKMFETNMFSKSFSIVESKSSTPSSTPGT